MYLRALKLATLILFSEVPTTYGMESMSRVEEEKRTTAMMSEVAVVVVVEEESRF